MVFDAEGYTFTCAAVKKAGKRYKYYVSTQAVKKSYDDCPIKTLSAPLLEGVIIEQIRRILTRPEWSKSVLVKVKELLNDDSPDDTKIVQTLQNFDLLWDELFPLEQQRLAKLIIQKVVVYPEKVIIALRPLGMVGLLHEMMPDAKMKKGQPTENTPLEITIPIKLKKHGGRKYITTPDGRDLSVARRPKYENNMIKAIGRGHQYLEMLEAEPDLTIMKLAEREMLDHG